MTQPEIQVLLSKIASLEERLANATQALTVAVEGAASMRLRLQDAEEKLALVAIHNRRQGLTDTQLWDIHDALAHVTGHLNDWDKPMIASVCVEHLSKVRWLIFGGDRPPPKPSPLALERPRLQTADRIAWTLRSETAPPKPSPKRATPRKPTPRKKKGKR